MIAPHRLAALLFVCLVASTTGAEVSDQLEYRYYTAQAQAGKSLYQVLQAASPIRENGRVFLGHTNRDIEWRLHWQDTARGTCGITDVRVTLQASILLPQLNGIDPDRQVEFTRFLMALRIHETGHYRIYRQAATQIDAALAALPETANCHEMEDMANSTARRILAEFDQRDAQYDAATNYGRTQGAVLQN
jgi:predicted secreted Zn-dependent protease